MTFVDDGEMKWVYHGEFWCVEFIRISAAAASHFPR